MNEVLAHLPDDVRALVLSTAAGSAPAQTAERASAPGDPLARRLPIEPFDLNDQQMAIVDSVVGKRQNTVVRALAGTGKTSTLAALAHRLRIDRPEDRILYIAFNRSVRQEAEARMPGNVESRTGHSLAWQAVGSLLSGKMSRDQLRREHPDIAASDEAKYLRSRPQAIGRALGLSPVDAQTVRMAVDLYANSDDDDLSMQHLERLGAERELPHSRRERLRLLDAAQDYWEDITTPLGSGTCRFAASNDHLRKIWALGRPDFTKDGSGVRIPASVVFLDEAQDTPPVLARVVDEQRKRVQVVVVGDANQAIYGWAGARDYLSEVTPLMKEDLPLTTSYRFSDEIAETANLFLNVLGERQRVVGAGEWDAVGPVDDPDAVLTRTNAGMIEEVMREAAKGRRVGLLAETRADLLSLVDTTAHLRDGGPKPQRAHKVLGRYQAWDDVMTEAEQTTGTTELTVALGIISKWSLLQLAQVAESTAEVTDAARDACDVVIVTAHKAKGLEWDAVRIGDDFYGPNRKPPASSETEYDDPEHLKLDYVAVTRAKKRLDLGSLAWIRHYGGRRSRPRVVDAGHAPASMSCAEVDEMLLRMAMGSEH